MDQKYLLKIDKMGKQKEVFPTKNLCKKICAIAHCHLNLNTIFQAHLSTKNFDLDVLKTRYNLH